MTHEIRSERANERVRGSEKQEENNLLPFYYYISAILLHQQINKEFSAFQL